MERKKAIPIPVNGNIYLNVLEQTLLGTRSMQRLSHIKQLGFKYLYFPGATHSRLEHSLGTMDWASRIGSSLCWDSDYLQKARIYGLLHDIGHFPYSHKTESVIRYFTGKSHDDASEDIIGKGDVSDVLKRFGYSPEEILSDINLRKKIVSVVVQVEDPDRNMQPNADGIDYIQRDAYHCKVDFRMDIDLLLKSLKEDSEKKRIGIDFKSASTLYHYLLTRLDYYKDIYLIDYVPIAMYRRALVEAISNHGLDCRQFVRATDSQADSHLVSLGGLPKTMVDSINDGKLYKTLAEYIPSDQPSKLGNNKSISYDVFNKLSKSGPLKISDLEEKLEHDLNLRNGELLIDFSVVPTYDIPAYLSTPDFVSIYDSYPSLKGFFREIASRAMFVAVYAPNNVRRRLPNIDSKLAMLLEKYL